MNFKDYQEAAWGTAEYPVKGSNLIYPALGLAGEAGEAVDKIKKYWRNFGHYKAADLTDEQKAELIKEIGDVLWYIAAIASELKVDLGYVAAKNIEKLLDRQKRGVVKSEGDNR